MINNYETWAIAPEEIEAITRPMFLIKAFEESLLWEKRNYGPDTIIIKAIRVCISQLKRKYPTGLWEPGR